MKTEIEAFVQNIEHLIALANSRAEQHPRIMKVTWMHVRYESIPDRVQFTVHYEPDGGQVNGRPFPMEGRIIANRDEEAFWGACQQATE